MGGVYIMGQSQIKAGCRGRGQGRVSQAHAARREIEMAAPAERMEVRSYNMKYNELLSFVFVNYTLTHTHVFIIPAKTFAIVTRS